MAGTGKFICIWLNYSDHAAETGATVQPEPIIFMKATSAICGPNDPIIIPRGSQKADWEVELAVIIGTRAKYLTEAKALSPVSGYAVTNDVSERACQIERSGHWTKNKSCDNFGQAGQWLMTRDEVADPHDGLRRGASGRLAEPVHDLASERRYLDRNAARRGSWPEAAALS